MEILKLSLFLPLSTLKQTNENEKQITPEDPGEEAAAARRSAAEDRDGAGEESANATNANAAAGAAAADPLADVELGLLIGQGAYGRVYRGIWNGSPVAVKVIPHLSPAATGGKTSAGSGGGSRHGSGGAPATTPRGSSAAAANGGGGGASNSGKNSGNGGACSSAGAKSGAEGIRGALEMMHSVDLVSEEREFFFFSTLFSPQLFFDGDARKKTSHIFSFQKLPSPKKNSPTRASSRPSSLPSAPSSFRGPQTPRGDPAPEREIRPRRRPQPRRSARPHLGF